MIIQLALRNSLRNRGRLLLSTFAIAVASMLLVYATGQIGGVRQALVRGMTDSLTGHLLVKPKEAPREFFDASSGRRMHLIDAAQLQDVLARLRALEAVEAAAPRLRFSALIGNGEDSTPALIMAVDPAAEAKVTTDLAAILPTLAKHPQGALVSRHLVEKTGIAVGNEILVLTETPSEVFNGRPYDIKGHADSPVLIDEYMNAMFLVNIDRARKMIYVDDVATEIAVRVRPEWRDRLDDVQRHIAAALSPAERDYLGVYTYAEVASAVGSVGRIATGIAAIQVGTVLFIMLIIVLIITRMGLHERRTEIGMLMSLGMTRARLAGLFLAEVVFKVVVGYGIGLAIAMLMLAGLREAGGMRAATLVEQYMNGGKIMMPVIDPFHIAAGFVLVTAAAVAVTFISCWKAGAQDAVELLAARK